VTAELHFAYAEYPHIGKKVIRFFALFIAAKNKTTDEKRRASIENHWI